MVIRFSATTDDKPADSSGDSRLRGVLDGMDEGFVLLDHDFRIVEINSVALRLEHATRDAVIGKSHWEVWPNIENSALGKALKSAMSSQEPAKLKNHYEWPDGRHGWFDVRMYPASGGLSVFYRDVSERERAELELRETGERLSLATEHAEIAFWDVDPINDVLIWPARTKAMFGISPDAPVSMADFYNGLHPDDRGATVAAYAAATDADKRALYDVEYRTVGKEDQLIRWVAAKGRGLFDDAGRCIRVVGTAIDITERKRTQAALADSQERYQRLFETIDEGFCVIEFLDTPHGPLSDYVHVEANRAYETNAGIPHIVGKRLREIVSATEADAWAEIYRRVLVTGEPIRFERELVETGRHLELAAFRVEPKSRRQVAVIFQDVTERNRASAALQQLKDTLETRVAERSAALDAAHEQLRQSQKLEAMGTLTGGVAHDFNNLLTPIVGALDLLQHRKFGGTREKRLIAGAAQSAERAKTLVQRLLAFARRQPLQAVAVDVAKLVHSMVDLISSTIGPQIRIVVDTNDQVRPAFADANQLEMALLNLSVNARDAMPRGGTLHIEVSQSSGVRVGLSDEDFVCLTVADTGIGMDDETLRRAVEPFFSTKGIGQGTGLGLSMVHGLAAQLGGALRITSSLSVGTKVQLWLPLSPISLVEGAAQSNPDALPGRGTVLLVDDEEYVRLSTAEMLADLGFQVVEAASAEEALTVIDAGDPVTLVITDHLMPGMTGIELAHALRQRQSKLPVLIVSGYAQMEGIAPDLARLTKPFRRDELLSSIAALVVAPLD